MATIIPLPSAVKVKDQSFRLITRASIARTKGRAVQTKVEPFPYWTASFELVPLEELDFGRVESFMIKVRAGGAYFLGHKTGRKRPLAMDAGVPLSGVRAGSLTAFDGTATLAVITDSLHVDISGLPAGFSFTEGDMIEFRENEELRTLHMIAEDVVADVNGGVSLILNNPISTNVITTAAVVNLERPSCLMQIIDQPDQSKGVKFGSGAFDAQEVPV